MNRKPHKVYYGWWIVGASFLIGPYVAGVIFYGFTAIFEPIANEMGWSYTQISLAASLRGFEMGLLAPFVGILADRWGSRKLIFSGAILNAGGLILLSYTTSLVMFYAAFVLLAIGMSCCTMITLMTAVSAWFRKKVGIASGIMISGFGLSGLMVPVVVTLVDMYEWRMAVTILAFGMLVIVLPLSLLFRHKPEQYGYLPDGEVKSTLILDNDLATPQTVEVDVRAKQVFKTRAFWHTSLALMCKFMAVNTVVTHVMPYLSSIGIARATSGLVASAIPLLSIIGRLSFGWLGDKFDKRQIMASAFAMMSLGVFCLAYISPVGMWLLVPFLIFVAIGYGGNNTILPVLLRSYFGRSKFGTIYGFVVGIGMIGNVIGPTLAGWVFDTWGSYQGIWFVFAGLIGAAVALVLTIPPVSTTIRLANKA